MNEFINYAESVKREVKFDEAARFYGLTFNERGYASCPFHSDKTPSFHVQKSGNGKCFGCGWHGTVIDFVMQMFTLDFQSALRKLNSDFALNLPLDRKPTLREQREAEQRQRELSAERAKAEAEKQAYDTLYNALWDEYIRLDKQRRAYKPMSADEEINPLYVEAVSNISNVCYRIDTQL